MQENAHLSSQLAEAEHSLARERSVSEDKQARLTTGIEDLAAMQDEARKHVSEIERLQEAINTAEKQGERLTSEVAEKTRQLQEARQDAFELRERIGAMARAHSEDREMNTLLRRDKTLLSEQVADVEGEQMRALHDKERLTRENHRLHKKLQEASRQIAFMRKAQNIPWANLSDLAGQVQQFTTDMEAGE